MNCALNNMCWVRQFQGTKTPVTLEVFLEWKKKKAAERAAKEEAAKKDRKKADRLSGRDVFENAKAEDFKVYLWHVCSIYPSCPPIVRIISMTLCLSVIGR